MEQFGEENRIPFYSRTFYEINEETCMGIENWLRNEAGKAGDKWASNFMGLYYYQCGYEQSDVGVMGDLYIEIYDSQIAFQFEMFKVGGRARDNRPSGFDPYDDKFNITDEDFID